MPAEGENLFMHEPVRPQSSQRQPMRICIRAGL